MNKRICLLLLGTGVMLVLAGCAGNEEEPQAAENPTESPTEAMVEAPTAEPTEAPEPTETAEPPTATPEPTETAEPEMTGPTLLVGQDLFSVFGDKAVVPRGPAGSWYETYTDPGAVVYHDGMFHMFHNGFNGWPAPVGIAYSRSVDGEHWEMVQDDPVFVGDDLDYVGLTVLASSALVEDDGTWVLYFYTWDQSTWPAPTKIGRATAPAPTGPWTADPEPILVQGSEGEWDDYAVRVPSVVKTGDGYMMFYTGYTRQQGMIGMATSPDGIHWTKYNDPATTEAPYAESDPVFVAAEGDAWDNAQILQPRVVSSPDGLVMLYSAGSAVNGSAAKLGYAISQDGIHWERVSEPIFDYTRVNGGRAIWFTELSYEADVYYLFFELGTGGNTEVYVATHEGSLIGG
ncbi:MAG: hypothetical protein WAM60_26500 [Candidatus Promineifilaceae bacterium]